MNASRVEGIQLQLWTDLPSLNAYVPPVRLNDWVTVLLVASY